MEMNVAESTQERDSWGRPIEFLLTLIGYSVGLGNILRFPYVCMQNGGGAFLIPYFLCLFICGIPLVTMELFLGQKTRRTCIICWNQISPIIQGAGYCMQFTILVVIWEYQTYITWTLYYLVASCSSTLPWAICNATWNTPNCTVFDTHDNSSLSSYSSLLNISDGLKEINSDDLKWTSAAEEYWENNALELSSGIEELGGIRWQLAVAHLVGWVLVYLCIIRGIHSVGKIVWVTSLLPYVLITIFLIRAATLPGSMEGVTFYITPNLETLKSLKVWMIAFIQIFYSLGPGCGILISMASFNDYKHPFYREGLLVPLINGFTSLYAGFTVFSAAGFLAHKTGRRVDEVVKSGPGMGFVTYPEIATHLPAGPVWSILFFLMILMVALDSVFVFVVTVVSVLKDVFHLTTRQTQLATLSIVLLNMAGGLLFSCRAGMYIMQIVDWYCFVVVVLFACLWECIATMWFYGYDNFSKDLDNMIGLKPPKYLILPLLGVIIPVLLISGLVWSCLSLRPPTYGNYIYPDWVGKLGIGFSIALILPWFFYIIYKLLTFVGPDFKVKLRKFVFVERRKTNVDVECEPLGL